ASTGGVLLAQAADAHELVERRRSPLGVGDDPGGERHAVRHRHERARRHGRAAVAEPLAQPGAGARRPVGEDAAGGPRLMVARVPHETPRGPDLAVVADAAQPRAILVELAAGVHADGGGPDAADDEQLERVVDADARARLDADLDDLHLVVTRVRRGLVGVRRGGVADAVVAGVDRAIEPDAAAQAHPAVPQPGHVGHHVIAVRPELETPAWRLFDRGHELRLDA